MKGGMVLLVILLGVFVAVQSWKPDNTLETKTSLSSSSASASQVSVQSIKPSLCKDFKDPQCIHRSFFYEVDARGEAEVGGKGKVFILDPSSKGFSYKVVLPFASSAGQEFGFYNIEQLLDLPTSQVANKKLLFAINSDYIDIDATPQGLNSDQGKVYEGLFAKTRSSFGLSKPDPQGKVSATIAQGLRAKRDDNYFLVGGNGRFYKDFQFINICSALGESACKQETVRSMVAVTDAGYVIFSVYDDISNPLTPDKFDTYFTNITKHHNLGKIRDGMLFDGGRSPAMWYDGQWQMQSFGPIGSAFSIYY